MLFIDDCEYFDAKPGYHADMMCGSELNIETDANGNMVRKWSAYDRVDNYDSFIVSVWNNKDTITRGVHTMCISRNEDGTYTVHNGYVGDKPYYESVEEALADINDRNVLPISLIGVIKDE